MGIFTSGDIKIYKVDKLFGDINGVKMYIEYKLVLSKEKCPKHMECLRVIFARLRNSILKVNAKNTVLG